MEHQNRNSILLLIVSIYVICSVAIIQISTSIPIGDTHTTLSVTHRGDKALFRLYKMHFDTNRMLNDWSSLSNKTSLLIISEPLVRKPTKTENKSLEEWVREGGTLFYLLSPSDSHHSNSSKPELLKNTFSTLNLSPANIKGINSPFLIGVKALSIDATFSDIPAAFTQILKGEIAERHYGEGKIILVSSAGFITNQQLMANDNAVFAFNVASYTLSKKPGAVSFDEYHQGLGLTVQSTQAIQSDFKTYWHFSPIWLRYALLAMLLIGLMYIYNGNRTFGEIISPKKQEVKNFNTVDALAGLFLKANANEYARNIIEDNLKRSIYRKLDLPNSLSQSEFIDTCKALHISDEEIDLLFDHKQKEHVRKKLSKAELERIALKIDEIKRRLDLVE